jgi:hypothetical protein
LVGFLCLVTKKVNSLVEYILFGFLPVLEGREKRSDNHLFLIRCALDCVKEVENNGAQVRKENKLNT